MAIDTFKIPLYVRAAIVFIGLFAFTAMLYIAQRIIVPLIYATIIAIVLSPLVDFWVRLKVNRVAAITISLILVLLTSLLFLLLVSSQFSFFTASFPLLVDKFSDALNRATTWASLQFNISPQNINAFIAHTKVQILSAGTASVGDTIASIGSSLVILVLIPVYVFMLLFYRPLLLDFIHRVSGEDNLKQVNDILFSTKTIIRRYLIALVLEAAIIATLNSVGLLIIGIDYAIMLGIAGALLNVIPYIGGIIAFALPILVALVTKSTPTAALLVVAVYSLIQFIDNHYIIPKLVASKVRINALIAIIVVLVGGALWGIPGMFLSIPLTAILKVICDHIDSLKPYGILLGDTMPTITVFKIKSSKKT